MYTIIRGWQLIFNNLQRHRINAPNVIHVYSNDSTDLHKSTPDTSSMHTYKKAFREVTKVIYIHLYMKL